MLLLKIAREVCSFSVVPVPLPIDILIAVSPFLLTKCKLQRHSRALYQQLIIHCVLQGLRSGAQAQTSTCP